MIAVAIGFKIPDNAAFTALVALRRLGVKVERVERNEIRLFPENDGPAALTTRIKADETIFNPNLHRLTLLESAAPRSGEVWILPLERGGRGPAAVAWRLLDANDEPATRAVLAAAAERLLCNPAIERAVLAGDAIDRDISTEGE